MARERVLRVQEEPWRGIPRGMSKARRACLASSVSPRSRHKIYVRQKARTNLPVRAAILNRPLHLLLVN